MNLKFNEPSITPIGITDWRNTNIPFGIKDADRLRHMYVIGKTGVGKSTLLLNMAISDIKRGKGLCLIDPHGDIAESVLEYVPKERVSDVIYFNPADTEYTISFNPLDSVSEFNRHLTAAGLVSTFKKIWFDSWGPRLEYILQFVLLTLLEYPKATLLDIQPLLTDSDFRHHILSFVKDNHVLVFWHNEFEKYPYPFKMEAISPILNKIGVFSTNVPLRNIVGQSKNSFDIKAIMDERKILICNLSKGVIGEEVSSLIGSMLLNSIQLTAMQRASQKEYERIPFYLYVDEMHSFVSLSFINILSEARKYGLSLFLTHQYTEQINEKVLSAILGNVGTIIAFRVGSEDATYLETEFKPPFNANDLENLPPYSMYIKLMIDGASSKPFSAVSLPIAQHITSYTKNLILNNRDKYCMSRKEIKKTEESSIKDFRNTVQGKLFF